MRRRIRTRKQLPQEFNKAQINRTNANADHLERLRNKHEDISSSDIETTEENSTTSISKPHSSSFRKRSLIKNLSFSSINAIEVPDINELNQNRFQSAPPKYPIKFLDRYKIMAKKNSSIFTFEPTTRRYVISRSISLTDGLLKRTFRMFKPDGIEIAYASFAGIFSKEISVFNSRGLVCELDTEKDRLDMRNGCDIVMSIHRYAHNQIHTDFFEVDGIKPISSHLDSSPCIDLGEAFGERLAISSVKNVKLCYEGKEYVAVRKVAKDELEVDVHPKISFLAAFAITIFMFIS